MLKMLLPGVMSSLVALLCSTVLGRRSASDFNRQCFMYLRYYNGWMVWAGPGRPSAAPFTTQFLLVLLIAQHSLAWPRGRVSLRVRDVRG